MSFDVVEDDDHGGEINMIDFQTMEYMGHIDDGGMANISLYKWNREGSTILVAKKSLFRGSMESRYRSGLEKEMSILAQLDHENIVRTYGAVETDHDFGLVMEYHPFKSYLSFFGDLWENTERTQTIEKVLVPLKIKIISEIISAMNYLHHRNPPVLHLDLKGENVLLNNELHAKICDFGLSQMRTLSVLRSRSTVLGGYVGTTGYVDPQRLHDIHSRPTIKSDVYAFGILIWEILTDKLSYAGLDNNLIPFHVETKQLRPDVFEIPQIIPAEIVNMMKECWAQEADDRPTFEELEEDIQSIINRIPDFKGQVRQSRIQTLTLYRSLLERVSTSTQESSQNRSERDRHPHSSRINSRYQSSTTNLTERPTSAPTCGSVTKPMTDRFNENRYSHREITDDELAPLLPSTTEVPRFVVEKKFMSIKKIMIALALFFSFCAIAAVGVVIWKTENKNNLKCEKLGAPTHGNVTCSNETDELNIKCDFYCDKGYAIVGKETVFCTGGKWNDKKPTCERTCEKPNPILHGELNCTNKYFVNSTCTANCLKNHQIQGNKTLSCRPNGNWSNPEPYCVCPHCYVGENCEDSILWSNVDSTLDSLQMYQVQPVNYGGHIFTCTAGIYNWFKFHGKCEDAKYQQSQDCNAGDGYDSASGGAKHAAAQLIRNLAQQRKYPLPCDSQNMPTDC